MAVGSPRTVGRSGTPLVAINAEILDDLGSRFVINVPEEERKDLIRICFQLELAHWFYLDFYCSGTSVKSAHKSCSIREFAAIMFKHIHFLRKHAHNVDKILEDWKEYKLAVPTYGAIILNQNLSHVLLVQGFWAKNSWGFPKGKVNEEEEPHHCAIREVLEETGFDISPIISPNQFLETVINDQTVRLYVIPGVPTRTEFKPRTRCEIRDVKWFPLVDIPTSKKDLIPKNLGLTHNGLYMVMPFVKNLRKWVSNYYKNQRKEKMNVRKESVSEDQKNKRKERNRVRALSHQQRKTDEDNQQPQQQLNPPKTKETPAKQHQKVDKNFPKSWTSFSINKKDMLSALSSAWN